MKRLIVKPIMSVEKSDLLMGQMVTPDMVKQLITYDCDVYDKESGNCLAKFRKGVIPGSLCVSAYENFKGAAMLTDSRGVTTGDEVKTTHYRTRKDGSASKQTVAKSFIHSGVAGYYDRSPRFPFCRMTAFTMNEGHKYAKGLPIVYFVDKVYRKLMPKEYKKQKKLADQTSKDFTIKGTAFTTVTVNKNYATAIHKDAGDFKEGFGNLVALREGEYDGCYLTLPRWGVGFDLRNSDLLLMDVHQWHGNTPMIKQSHNATRLSLVMYYRENMIHCETARKENERVRNRKRGSKLNDK